MISKSYLERGAQWIRTLSCIVTTLRRQKGRQSSLLSLLRRRFPNRRPPDATGVGQLA
jgi:hypothetical protein